MSGPASVTVHATERTTWAVKAHGSQIVLGDVACGNTSIFGTRGALLILADALYDAVEAARLREDEVAEESRRRDMMAARERERQVFWSEYREAPAGEKPSPAGLSARLRAVEAQFEVLPPAGRGLHEWERELLSTQRWDGVYGGESA